MREQNAEGAEKYGGERRGRKSYAEDAENTKNGFGLG